MKCLNQLAPAYLSGCFSKLSDSHTRVLRAHSEIQDIEIGVPQGSCLGPLLFLLYVNDLPFALKKAHATMYADDTTICYSSDNIEDLNAVVNAELTCLNDWLRGNKLSLSIIKTQAMVIGSKRK